MLGTLPTLIASVYELYDKQASLTSTVQGASLPWWIFHWDFWVAPFWRSSVSAVAPVTQNRFSDIHRPLIAVLAAPFLLRLDESRWNSPCPWRNGGSIYECDSSSPLDQKFLFRIRLTAPDILWELTGSHISQEDAGRSLATPIRKMGNILRFHLDRIHPTSLILSIIPSIDLSI